MSAIGSACKKPLLAFTAANIKGKYNREQDNGQQQVTRPGLH